MKKLNRASDPTTPILAPEPRNPSVCKNSFGPRKVSCIGATLDRGVDTSIHHEPETQTGSTDLRRPKDRVSRHPASCNIWEVLP